MIASISKRPDPSAISDILREQGDEICAEADAVAVEADIDDGIMKQILSLAEKHRKQVYALVSQYVHRPGAPGPASERGLLCL